MRSRFFLNSRMCVIAVRRDSVRRRASGPGTGRACADRSRRRRAPPTGMSSIRIGTCSSFSRAVAGSSCERLDRDPLELVLGDRDRAGGRGEVEPADLLPRHDHRGVVVRRLVDAAEQVERVGLRSARRPSRAISTQRSAPRGSSAASESSARSNARSGSSIAEVESSASALARAFGSSVASSASVRTKIASIRSVFLVDEVERRLERVERGIGIAVVVELEARDADARHRIVGPELGELGGTSRAPSSASPLRIGDRRGEGDDVGVLAVDAWNNARERLLLPRACRLRAR